MKYDNNDNNKKKLKTQEEKNGLEKEETIKHYMHLGYIVEHKEMLDVDGLNIFVRKYFLKKSI